MKVKLTLIALTIVVIMVVFQCQNVKASQNLTYKEAFLSLEEIISKRKFYLDKKLRQIDELQQNLKHTKHALDRFNLCRTLFQMNYDLKIDIAAKFAKQMLELAETSLKSQQKYKDEALLLIARTYAYKGMYKECMELLDKNFVLAKQHPNELKQLYFIVQTDLYKGLEDQAIIQGQIKAYREEIMSSLDSLLIYTPKNSIWYSIYLSNKFKAQHQYLSATQILLKTYNKLSTKNREMAIVAFYLADLSRLKGEFEQEKLYLVTSAITDVEYAVKEYVSLWKLATILHKEGDIETAYRFIEISLQDAIYSGAYRWKLHIIKILPEIYTSYKIKIIAQKNTISNAFFIIVCLLICSVLLSIYIVGQYKKLGHAKGQLGKMNDDLKKVNNELNLLSDKLNLSNEELQTNNSQLIFLNNELVSTNLLKETYLSKFIDLCSDYIDKIDDYRNNLKRLLKSGKVDKIEKELQSTEYIEKEHKIFLNNFDETFLKLYPNFVIDFNSLFPGEEQQKIKNNELLTTELRVFALIRLGITDSYKIAKFLRCSITTIYTYRSKMKNKSHYPESFELKIRSVPEQVSFSIWAK